MWGYNLKGKQNGLPQNQRNPPLKPTAESMRVKTGHTEKSWNVDTITDHLVTFILRVKF